MEMQSSFEDQGLFVEAGATLLTHGRCATSQEDGTFESLLLMCPGGLMAALLAGMYDGAMCVGAHGPCDIGAHQFMYRADIETVALLYVCDNG